LWVATEAGLEGIGFDGLYQGDDLTEGDVHSRVAPAADGATPGMLALLPDGERVVGLPRPLEGEAGAEALFLDLVAEGPLAVGPDDAGRVDLAGAGRTAALRDLALSPDGTSALVVFERNGQAWLALLDTTTGARLDLDEAPGIQNLALPDPAIDAVAISLHGRIFLGGGGGLTVFETSVDGLVAGEAPSEHSFDDGGHALAVRVLAVAPDGTALFAAGGRRLARLDLMDAAASIRFADLMGDEADVDGEVTALVVSEASAERVYACGVFERGEGDTRFHDSLLAVDLAQPDDGWRLELSAGAERAAVGAGHRLAVSRDDAWVFVAVPGAEQLRVIRSGSGLPRQEPLPLGAPVLDVATLSQAHRELCNGLDDDCDGQVDEDFHVGDPCEAPGVCGAGYVECAGLLADARCDTAPGGSASPAAELDADCDGEDDDCDGEADDDVGALAGDPIRLTDDGGSKLHPRLTVSADGFAVVWVGYPAGNVSDVLFQRFDPDGAPLGEPLVVTNGEANSHTPDVAAAGENGYGITWHGGGVGQFTRLERDGERAFLDPPSSSYEAHAVGGIAWLGNAFGVGSRMTAVTNIGERFLLVHMRRYDVAGVHLGGVQALRRQFARGGSASASVAIARSDAEYVLAWHATLDEQPVVTLSRHGPGGGQIATQALCGWRCPAQRPVSVAFSGGLGLAGVVTWGAPDGDQRRPLLLYRAWNDVAVVQVATARESAAAAVAASLDGFAVVWDDVRDGAPGIYAAFVALGDQVEAPIRAIAAVDNPLVAVREPRVVSTGDGFGTVYVSGMPGAEDLYYVPWQVGCR